MNWTRVLVEAPSARPKSAGLTVRSGHSVIVRDVAASTTLQADWADRMVGQGFHGVMALPCARRGTRLACCTCMP